MKKIITLAALICALALVTACGEKDDNTQTQGNNSVTSASFIVDSENAGTDEAVTGEGSEITGKADDETDSDTSDSDADNSSSNTTSSKAESNTSSALTVSEEEATDVEADTEYTVSAEEVESSLSGYENEIVGQWTAQYILDNENNEVSGEEIYGTAYKQYGGTMILNDDGTFSVKMGVNTDDESTKGTFSYNGGAEITLLYYNDTTTQCERCTINGQEAIAMPLNLFGDVFTVYFTMQ